jgi:hypothetical protein
MSTHEIKMKEPDRDATEDVEIDEEPEIEDALDLAADEPDVTADESDVADSTATNEVASTGEETAALDELAEEELELLAEEEGVDIPIDEVEELRALRREELSLNVQAEAIRGDEFVCSVCFLVKRSSQLANKRKVICRDCAA